MRQETGNKYEETKHLDVKEIAKLIRSDITSGKKDGSLPKELKTSVRIERFAGGQALRLEITSLGDIELFSDLAKEHIKETGSLFQLAPNKTHTDEYKELEDALTKIHNSYNFDNSDPMTDYFHVNYYGRVELDWELRNAALAKVQIQQNN